MDHAEPDALFSPERKGKSLKNRILINRRESSESPGFCVDAGNLDGYFLVQTVMKQRQLAERLAFIPAVMCSATAQHLSGCAEDADWLHGAYSAPLRVRITLHKK